jgi:hypothetical protein
MAMGWTDRGSNHGGVETLHVHSDQSRGTPNFLKVVKVPFPRIKAAGAWPGSPTASSAEVMKEWIYTSIPPSAMPSWHVIR